MFQVIGIDKNMNAAKVTEAIVHNFQQIENLKLNFSLSFNLCKILAVFPMSDRDRHIYSKLRDDEKLGFLTRFLTKAARSVNVPNVYIRRFQESKDRYRRLKNGKYWKRGAIELFNETMTLMEATMDMRFKDHKQYYLSILKIVRM